MRIDIIHFLDGTKLEIEYSCYISNEICIQYYGLKDNTVCISVFHKSIKYIEEKLNDKTS